MPIVASTTRLDPAFSLSQLETLVAWGAAHPDGFRANIAPDYKNFLEVAEVYGRDPGDILYLLSPTEGGTIILAAVPNGEWELPTVEAALAKVLELEAKKVKRG